MRAALVVVLAGCFSKPPPPSGADDGGFHDGAMHVDGSTPTDGSLCAHWDAFVSPTPIAVQSLAGTGGDHVTISEDGLELLYDQTGSLYETVRAGTGMPFPASGTVPGFDLLSDAQPAWLTRDRTSLYYIEGSMLSVAQRASTATAFATPGTTLFPAEDATVSNDQLHIVSASNGKLELATLNTPLGQATQSTLLDDPSIGAIAPSFGAHDQKLVWAQYDVSMPTVTTLKEADFTGTALANIHDLGLGSGDFDNDPTLSDNGATMYFTSTRNTMDPTSQLYFTMRSCN